MSFRVRGWRVAVAAIATWGFVTGAPLSAASLDSATVMAPLVMPQNITLERFEQLLDEAKTAGVNSVSVDVWWGRVEPADGQPFAWTYYDDVFGRIRRHGLKIAPILSFHKCGGGPNDDCNIPLPGWLYGHFAAANLSADDIKYESETGAKQDDALPPWTTETPAVLAEFSEFMREFATQYRSIANDMTEINISLGPTGELRYPAYNAGDGWVYPDRGRFQAYSPGAQASFRTWALAKFGGLAGVAARWGIPLASPADIRPPGGHLPGNGSLRAQTFVDDNDYADTAYGKDFIDWYNEVLVDHGRRLLTTAHTEFNGAFAATPLALKVPGVHWQMKSCAAHPRIAEITAGLVQTTLNLSDTACARPDAYGYKRILDMVAGVKHTTGRPIILHFTAAEMDNDPSCGSDNSMAEALVFWMSQAATDRGLVHKAENALPCVSTPNDDRSWDHIRNVFSHSGYSGFNLLRLVDHMAGSSCNPWGVDRAAYGSFIGDYAAARTTVHLAEWEPCQADQQCTYAIHTWDGHNGTSDLHYEGYRNGRHWWVGTLPARQAFRFTFGNTKNYEGKIGQYDRQYDPAVHGGEIFVIGRGGKRVHTTRP